jgi:hypothetical protein
MLLEKPSALKRENLAHQNLKFLHFFDFSIFVLWVNFMKFALLDSDPADQNQSGSADPDPKNCY